ncbi:hypothetical protein KIN20_009412 [Parelaphostrongylus tenuis]|uniref:Uncharacterized protein n=1 Tax=Parelaphostrongylus tenuis TaxID=148309 RepID=A0AAD5M862_PARTN|nr:hypothetical protein KIN20_009412 [Parelaphostrongylus tenuis]
MNQNSSRSFGLSFAHRYNTRAVSLLLLQADYLHDEEILNIVFDNCVNWIVDPCQQFSIKLVIEWLLVRLAVRLSKFRQRLFDVERMLASKRTGSLCSWINMLVLLSRSEGNEVLLYDNMEVNQKSNTIPVLFFF